MERGEKERKALENGLTLICGVDEAGRGPLAGPVYAAACILKEGYDLPGLNDSKKLTEKKRDLLFEQVKENCICYCVASASEDEIDAYNSLRATPVSYTHLDVYKRQAEDRWHRFFLEKKSYG